MRTITPTHLFLISKFRKTIFLFFYFSLITISPSAFGQSIYINEFMAANSNTINDEFGESDDWVELYNDANTPIDIGGMYLTDNLSKPTKWQIPTSNPALTTIPGKGFILLWFDGSPEQGILHVDTKLGANGESIGLYQSDGSTVIDSLSYSMQTTDISQGLEEDGENNSILFSIPTPGTSNEDGDNGLVAMPQADIKGGHYENEIEVTLSISTSGATIRYTTDGSEPTSSSSFYSGPIEIDETTPLRARGFKSNFEPSRIMTHSYLFDVSHTWPVICLTTEPDNFYGDDIGIYENWDEEELENPVHLEFFEVDGSLGFQQDLGGSIHGGGSAANDLKGLNIIARSIYGDNTINYKLFPELEYDEYASFLLRASGNDEHNTMLRDALASSLVREMEDVDSCIEDPNFDPQAYRPSIVYLNGEYLGIHNVRERLSGRYVERRYDIDKDEVDIIVSEEEALRGNSDAWSDFYDFIDDNDFTDQEMFDSLQTYMEIDHFLDYLIFNIYVDNTDWPGNNNRRFRERKDNKKWRWMVYDLDFGFGLGPLTEEGWNSGDWNTNSLEMLTEDDSDRSANRPESTLLIRKLFERDDIITQFSNRMADQLNLLYNSDRVVARVDSFRELYEPEMTIFRDLVDDRPWEIYMGRVRGFAENRTDAVWDQFEDFFDDIDDVVDLELSTSPVGAGKIELNTMRFSPDKLPWQGRYFEGLDIPISTVPQPGYIFTNWSESSIGNETTGILNLDDDEQIVANFIQGSTQIGNIVINEINYNSPEENDSGDWIELYNASDQAIDISGWIFEDKSDYFNLPANTVLAPNAYLVIAGDSEKFQNVYPDVDNFIGSFEKSIFKDFKLSNSGEHISISNANRTFRDTVEYNDKLPWPEEPDGTGPTLQLRHPNLNNALAENWISFPGTPGKLNPSFSDLLCTNQSFVALPGATDVIVNWELPEIFTTCNQNVGEVTQVSGPVNGSLLPIGITTVEYMYQTGCGVNPSCSFTITVIPQNSELIFNCLTDNIILNTPVGSTGSTVQWLEPTASSNCSFGNTTATQTTGLENGSFFPLGTSTISYQAQDACQNTQTCNFDIILLQDELTYDFECPENFILTAPIGATGMIANWTVPTGTTNCEVNAPLTTQTTGPSNGSFLPVGDTYVEYEFKAGCDFSITCGFIITINAEPAVLEYDCPDNIEISTEVGSTGQTVSWLEPMPTSNCFSGDASIQQTAGPNNGDFFFSNTNTTISYQITDPCNNLEICSFSIQINQDELSYDLDCENDIIENAPIGSNGMTIEWDIPNTETNCEIANDQLNQITGPPSGSFFTEGTTTIEYAYNTGCGVIETCSFDITVNTQEATLNLNCPNNFTVNAPIGLFNATVEWDEPTLETDCSLGESEFEQTEGPQSGDTFPVGITTISYQANDECDNIQNCSFEITVIGQEATLSFECPQNISINAPIGANSASVEWNEPIPISDCSFGDTNFEQTEGPENGDDFPVGITIVSYEAEDDCDNVQNCVFQIEVIKLEATLSFECPQNISINAPIGANSASVEWNEPMAISDCSFGDTDFEQTEGPENGDDFPVGITIVSYEAEDDCDNEQECAFQIEVIKQEATLNFECPQNISINAPIGANSTPVEWNEPIAISDCSIGNTDFEQIEGPENGDDFPVGITIVSYEAEDDCDNEQECSFIIEVIKQEATLNFECSQNISVNTAVGMITTSVEWELPIANSDCSFGQTEFEQIEGPESGDQFPIGTTIIVYQAEDDCDNEEDCSFEINVLPGEEIAELNCVNNLNANAPVGAEGIIVTWPIPNASTNCEIGNSELIQTQGPVNGSFLPIGVTTIAYMYTTDCGTLIECSFDILIEQAELIAEMTCSQDLEFTIPFGENGLVVNWLEPEVSTNCQTNVPQVTQNTGPKNGSFLEAGEYLVEYEFDSGCSIINCDFTINILEVDSTTSIQNQANESNIVNLFPNPGQGLINLEISELSSPIVAINIYDHIGSLIESPKNLLLLEVIIPIDLTNYSSGIYLLILQLENGEFIPQQFVISK